MVNSAANILNVFQKAEDKIDDIVDIMEELDAAKLTIDMCPCKVAFKEKAKIYIDRFLKLGAKKCILSVFCAFIVIPISLAFLEAGGVPPVLSVLILTYMVKKRARVVLEESGCL